MSPARTSISTPIHVHESIGRISRAEWDGLAAAANAPVFAGYDFVSSMESHPLSQPSRPVYLTMRYPGGQLAAALVVYLQDTVDPFAPAAGGPVVGGPVVRMLTGGVWHCYDTVLLAARPLTADVVAAFVGTLREVADDAGAALHGLVNVEWAGPLAALLADAGLAAAETTPRYRLRVGSRPGQTADLHLTRVGRSSRRTMRQYVRRAERAGARVTFTRGTDALAADVLGLCVLTADKHAPGYYPPEQLSALVERLGSACRIIRIDLDGVLLATSICLLDASRAHFWAGGCLYPPELNWSPQYVLFHAELQAGLRLGRPVLEFGRRNDEFKQRYGLEPCRLGRFVSG